MSKDIEAEKKLSQIDLLNQIDCAKYSHTIGHGFDLIIQNLGRVSGGQLVQKELALVGIKLKDEIDKFTSKNEDLMGDKVELLRNEISKYLLNQEDGIRSECDPFDGVESLREKLMISEEIYGVMYEIARLLFSERSIEEARAVFSFLSVLDVKCHEVWFSLGLCNQIMKEWKNAIGNYALAIFTNPSSINGYINSALCYRELGDQENAIYMLKLAGSIIEELDITMNKKTELQSFLIQKQLEILNTR